MSKDQKRFRQELAKPLKGMRSVGPLADPLDALEFRAIAIVAEWQLETRETLR